MSLNPSPGWPKVHIELYESPGWFDDCFRSSLWVNFLTPGATFVTGSNVAGDYAAMIVTEGAVPAGCGWEKHIHATLTLLTNTYPVAIVKLRGTGTTPQYRIVIEYTDTTTTDTGWVNAPATFTMITLLLTAGKTIDYVRLYAKSSTAFGTATIDYDYAFILRNPPLVPDDHKDLEVDLQPANIAVSGFRFKVVNDILLGVCDRWYKLDENVTNSKCWDLSKNKLHASPSGNPTYAAGKFGTCLHFVSASSQRVATQWAPTLGATSEITFTFWVKATTGETGIIAGNGKAPGGVFNRLQFGWGTGADLDKIRLYVKDDAANIRQVYTPTLVADGTWHFIAGVVSPKNDYIRISVDGAAWTETAAALGATTLDLYDLTIGCLHNESGYTSYTDADVDDFRIYNVELAIQTIRDELYTRDPLRSGAARAPVGTLVGIYVAANSETLVYKLLSGRVTDRDEGGDPDDPYVEFIGEDHGEILLERTFTKEYASLTQISTIVGDVQDIAAPELFQDIDVTNRTIRNNFRNEGVFALLQKLAETATFATGENGANFYVDPGVALRFKKYGAFTCVNVLTDGSDGNPENLNDLKVSYTMKGTPRLVNDVKVIVMEAEYAPADKDAWTETAEGWSSPDPTDAGYPNSDADVKVGTASIKFQMTAGGDPYRMELWFPDTDIADFDSLKFWIKRGAGITFNSLDVRLQKGDFTWVADYYEETGLTDPGAGVWEEKTILLTSFGITGNPSTVVNHFRFTVNAGGGVGTGGILIDGLHFVKNEKYGSDSDATSQASYGKRTLRLVEKAITNVTYAGYVADNIVANRKDPLCVIKATVPGRGQLGYRPPMLIAVSSLKHGLKSEYFQITRAVHRVSTKNSYEVDVEAIAALTSTGTYLELVGPVAPSYDLPMKLAENRRRLSESQLNSTPVQNLE